ncbi:outer membrane beta-barrel protein [Rhodonellum sp.]|uniref:outer membrane beta-barrel protein n=1 Tax=Rhodonellum sp. TaxID=2231180 RepID=UPI0027201DD9|nr:outer membrane beta-barrel protein [Rhodonellum sp.]MDO9554268.1 outer membrane beta-barrel protein [Rhodonellum sp.]
MKHFFPPRRSGSFFLIGTLTFCLVLASFVSNAQNRWSVEFRPGFNLPTSDAADGDLKNGFGLEGTVAYRFLPNLSAYAGWSWNRFGSKESFAGTDLDFEETGYTYGLQFLYPLGASETSLLLRAGGLWNHVEIEDDDGNTLFDTGHGFGWQVEAGLSIPLAERFRLQPSVRYRSFSGGLEIGPFSRDLDFKYISLGLGLSYIF